MPELLNSAEIESPEVPSKGINWNVIWAIAAFFAGSIFSAGMGWGKNDSALQTMSTQLAEIKGSLGVLTEKYTISDKAVAQKLQELDDHFSRVEDHLSHDDVRLDKIEARQR